MIAVPNFKRDFDLFSGSTYRRFNDGPFTSFDTGAARGWEGYKPLLRQRALSALDPASWTADQVGSGTILEHAIAAIELPGNDQTRNNLVSWEGRYGPASAGHAPLLAARDDPKRCRAFERWFMDAFRVSIDPGALFERFNDLAGYGYPLAAYVFFLIDIERFAPIAPRTFDVAFRRLGIELVTSGQCSWTNYASYNDALEAVRGCLVRQPGLSSAKHIDAHSFCWMLVRMEEEESNPPGRTNAVRYGGSRERSVLTMAANAVRAVAESGRLVTTVRKDKQLHHLEHELRLIINKLIEEQRGLCAITYLTLQWLGESDDPAMLASLDRIDSTGHYAEGNLQVVCRFANVWKGASPDGEFRRLLGAVRNAGT